MPLHCIVSNIENVIVNILDKDIAAKMWDIFGAKNWRPLWDIKTKVCYHPKWISSNILFYFILFTENTSRIMNKNELNVFFEFVNDLLEIHYLILFAICIFNWR